VTKNTALILDNLKQEVSGRWSEHEIIGKKPKSEFTGADLRSFSFEIMVDINLGYKPHSILKKIHRLVEKGKVDTLMIGTHKIGSKWKMTNASDSFDVVYAGGELAKASISVTLKEY
jgi:phage protein U